MRFRSALGSTHEVVGCIDVAEAFGYVDAEIRARLDRIADTLYRLATWRVG